MKKRSKLALTLLLLTSMNLTQTSSAWADEDKIVAVKKGELVPFDGLVFPVDTALRWKTSIKDYQFQLQALPKAEQEKCEVKLNLAATETSMRLDVEAAMTESYRRKVIELEKPAAFYENPWFTFGLGIVVAGVGTGLIVWGVNR